MPAGQLAQAPFDQRVDDRSFEAEGNGHVRGGRCRFETIENPIPALFQAGRKDADLSLARKKFVIASGRLGLSPNFFGQRHKSPKAFLKRLLIPVCYCKVVCGRR